MAIASAEAYVLDVVDLHDGDRILTFLSAEHGRKRGVARGAKRKHSRFAGQLQPLAKVRVGWFEKEGRDLVRISSVELMASSDWLNRDLDDLLVGAYWAEHLVALGLDGEPAESQVRLLEACLRALAAGVPRGIVTRYFEVWVLRLAGVFPPPTECAICGLPLQDRVVMAARADGFAHPDCSGSQGAPISRVALGFLRRASREGPTEIRSGDLSIQVLAEIERLCAEVRREFLQRELKSYEVLRQVGIRTGLEAKES